jgi:hypothetical protein
MDDPTLPLAGLSPVSGKRLDARFDGGMDLVELFAQAADLAFGDAIHAQRFDQVIDRAGRDAMHIGSWMTAVSARSAIRRGSRKPGK